jgi:hypothetical protein
MSVHGGLVILVDADRRASSHPLQGQCIGYRYSRQWAQQLGRSRDT